MNKGSLLPGIKKAIPITVHVLFCTIILLIPFFIFSRNGGSIEYRHYTGYFIRTCVLIFLFYINYLVLIDLFLFKKQIILYFAINVILIASLVFIQNIAHDLLMTPPPMHKASLVNREPGPPVMMRIWGDYMLIIFVVGMSVAMKATTRWYKDSINLESIKATQLEADLKNLQNQLNPHFLFNTLNNIYSLIAIDKDKAQESVHRLSNLLRYVLYENDHRFVPIDKELEFTQSYIDLMRLRLPSEIKLNVFIRNEGCHNEIASLMFITLIENAFKHGVSNGSDSFINIKILIENNSGVLCTVENSLNKHSKDNINSKNSGIGLTNLKKRLELLYPNQYQFITEEKENSFTALLRIDF